ncbi:hypothetical protein [Roseomonas sp. USHLN139]|uniref:hypothetical protein n=1 Tax=Roseomonas sp. USHLN139 TaxID=3081298 RepID=UPI003B019E81
MASWPISINGNTYTKAMFENGGYVTAFPNLVGDIAAVGGDVQAMRDAVLLAYNAMLSQTYQIVPITAATNLVQATHNNRLLLLTGAGAPALLAANIGNGFSCVIENRRSTGATVSVSGIELRNARAHTKVAANGCAQLYVYLDGSALCARLVGDTEA